MLNAIDPAADRLAIQSLKARLSDSAVEEYLTGNGHRIAATRFLLEALQLPLPQWAERGASGRRAAQAAALDRFKQDYPDENLTRDYVRRDR
ncbi:hypothetical protein K3177_10005 [Qipengyuania sp. GH25]|uniref:Uncharacterized protein n=1 Tax=Qipengyuania pacifica TaxID=2860199 RepID=A0ABS7JFZ8_9SPHN|nr:hypothetical protein [Qipengyuania aerophila]MBX7488846.1 hypothetical protein [Qipengyuania aerophila]